MTSETHIYLGFGLTLERQSLKQCEKLNIHAQKYPPAGHLLAGGYIFNALEG